MARVVFHGRKGDVRQPYREGQENQLSTLGLVVNAIILWNTFYMDAALTHLRQQSIEIKEEDIARLSPLTDIPHFQLAHRIFQRSNGTCTSSGQMIISISPSYSQLRFNSSRELKNVYPLPEEVFKLKCLSVTLKVRNMGVKTPPHQYARTLLRGATRAAATG